MQVLAPSSTLLTILCTATLLVPGCPDSSNSEPNDLDALGKVNLKIKDMDVVAWIADDDDERRKGLMFRTAQEMATLPDGSERGMLFVFQRDERNGFWMRDTIIDLDIAFIDETGKIVQTFTMAAFDERPYRPASAYRYALEVNAGLFAKHAIDAGDHVEIPETILKRRQ